MSRVGKNPKYTSDFYRDYSEEAAYAQGVEFVNYVHVGSLH